MGNAIIGIDLGTTHSLCAIFVDSAPRLIPNAYEALDARLRYGQSAPGDNAISWSEILVTGDTHDGGADNFTTQVQPRGGAKPGPTLAERLEVEEPAQLYAELKLREPKSAADYYALAVLADLVNRTSRSVFCAGFSAV